MPASQKREQGSALIMALVFVTVVAVLVMAMLTLIDTNLRTTTVVATHTDLVYAADTGLAHTLESMRLDRTTCPTTGSSESLPDLTVDGTTVHLSCQTISGSSSGAEGWAIIATDPTSGITTQGGGTKTIEGPVFANNLATPSLTVHGDVIEKAGTACTVGAATPSGLTVSPNPPYAYSCVSRSTPTPAHELPSVPATASASVKVGSCTVYSPGKYTAANAPNLSSGAHYFRSGTYYFENVTLTVDSPVTGGERNELETRANSANTACDSYDEDSPTDTPGTGVQWILGGSSRINVTNHGQLELYSRSGGTEPRSGISVHVVTSAEASGGYVASTLLNSTSTAVISVGNGSKSQMTIHGTVYAPDCYIDTSATNGSEAQFQGGVVVGRLQLQSSASASGLVVSVDDAPVVRQVVITATAVSTNSDVSDEAVVTLNNDDPRSFTIDSWRTTRGDG